MSADIPGGRKPKGDGGDTQNSHLLSEDLLQGWLLLFLSHGPLHGYALAQKLEEVSHSVPHQTTIYRHLGSLEERGLLDSEWQMRDSSPPVRIYRLTDTGQKQLRRIYTRISQLQRVCRDFLTEAARHI